MPKNHNGLVQLNLALNGLEEEDNKSLFKLLKVAIAVRAGRTQKFVERGRRENDFCKFHGTVTVKAFFWRSIFLVLY